MAPCFRQSSQTQGLARRLSCGDLHGPLNLLGIGKTLTCERISAKEAPPVTLKVESTRLFEDGDMLEVRMVRQPDACLQAVKAAEIIQDDEKVARWIVGLEALSNSM